MISVLSPSRNDLRSHAIDRKRDTEAKSKWCPKWAVGDAAAVKIAVDGSQRPLRRSPRRKEVREHHEHARSDRRAKLARRQDLLSQKNINDEFTKDDTLLKEFLKESVLDYDGDVAYSFDARRGPSQGSEVLGIALTKAVKRFEDHQTSKLVRDEYEVLDGNIDAEESTSHELNADDDGFELI